jgi:methylamine dehydrogenase accessory protein MauD
MSSVAIMAFALLGTLLLSLGFLLLGALRSLALLAWRLDQLEATTPGRLNRNGLAPGARAPEFTLPDLAGRPLMLGAAGQRTLLVFVQSRCAPCHDIVPELNRLQRRRRDLRVLAVLHAARDEAPGWFAETRPEFPVALQEDWSVSKRYEVFATPFAFLIDEHGVILSKGILTSRQHVGLLLSTAARSTSPNAAADGAVRDPVPLAAHSPGLQVP